MAYGQCFHNLPSFDFCSSEPGWLQSVLRERALPLLVLGWSLCGRCFFGLGPNTRSHQAISFQLGSSVAAYVDEHGNCLAHFEQGSQADASDFLGTFGSVPTPPSLVASSFTGHFQANLKSGSNCRSTSSSLKGTRQPPWKNSSMFGQMRMGGSSCTDPQMR